MEAMEKQFSGSTQVEANMKAFAWIRQQGSALMNPQVVPGYAGEAAETIGTPSTDTIYRAVVAYEVAPTVSAARG